MNSKGKLLLSVVVSLIFFYLLFTNVSTLNIIQTLSTLKPEPLIYAFFCYLIVTLARGLRVYSLFQNDKVTALPAISAAVVHTFVSNLLPGRIGELSFVVIMNKFLRTHLAKNTISLIYLRIFDTFIVVNLFLISFIVAGVNFTGFTMIFLVLILIALALTAFYLDLFIGAFVVVVKSILIPRMNSNWSITQRIEDFLKLLRGFGAFRSHGLFTKNLVLTVIIWSFLMSANYFMVQAMGWTLAPFQLLFAACGAVLTSLIPIPSLANVGTYESGWVATFALLGISAEKALITGFTIHVINFTFSLILGSLGYLYLTFHVRRKA